MPPKSDDNNKHVGKARLVLFILILSISMAAMGSSIVIESSRFPNNQWLLIVLYTAAFDFLFFLTLLFWYRMSSSEILSELKEWRQYSLIGLLWSMNYVFILLAAPYLSNTIQVVLAQFQSILIALVDWKYIGIQLNWRKWVCILASIALGLASIGFNASSSPNTVIITVFYSIMFLINSFAGGMASLSTEALLKVKRERIMDDESQLLINNQEKPKFDPLKQVLVLNFCANFYGIFFNLLGLPLAVFSLHEPAAGTGAPAPSYFDLIDVRIFNQIDILYWALMVFSSFIYTIMAGLIQLDQSAIFNAMCSSFGACLQLCFFLLPTTLRQPFELPSFLLAVSLTIVAGIYVATSDKRDMTKLMNSFVGRYCTSAIRREKQPLILPIACILVYFASWVAILAIWLS